MATYSKEALREVQADMQRLRWGDFLKGLKKLGFEKISERQVNPNDSEVVQIIAARKDLGLLLVAESKSTPLGVLLESGTVYGTISDQGSSSARGTERFLQGERINYLRLRAPDRYAVEIKINPFQVKLNSSEEAHLRLPSINQLDQLFDFVPWKYPERIILLEENAEANQHEWEKFKSEAPKWVLRFIEGEVNGIVKDLETELTEGDRVWVKIVYGPQRRCWLVDAKISWETKTKVIYGPVNARKLRELNHWLFEVLGSSAAERMVGRVRQVILAHIGRIMVETSNSPI